MRKLCISRQDRPADLARANPCLLLMLTTIVAFAAISGAGLVHAGNNQWTGNGPYGGQVTVLAVDPQAPNNLYAAGNSGVFKSTNGGTSWARASNGIIDPTVDALVIDPAQPNTLYAGSLQGGQLVKSTDSANSWTPSGPTLVVALAINPKSPATIYASRQQTGLSKSTDAGTNWTPIGVSTLPSFPTFTSIVVDPKTPSTLYAGEQSQGVFKSVDGGVTWAASNMGFTGPIIQVIRLAIDPQTTSTLYAAASTSGGDGLFKSTNGGVSWTKLLATGAANNFYIGTVTVDPQTPSTVYIGTGNGAFKSTDGGTSFTPVRTGLPTDYVNVLAINTQSPATVYAGTQNGVFATTNAGTGWTAASNGLALTSVTAVAVDPLAPTTIYAGTTVSGMFKSVDGGDSWTAINTGVPPTGNSGLHFPSITSLAIDPLAPNTVYAGTQFTQNSGVLKSTNGGATWANSATGIPDFLGVSALAIDPQVTSTIFAGLVTSGLFKSTDGGGHWSVVAGVPTNAHVTSLSIAVAPLPSGGISALAVTTDGNGIFFAEVATGFTSAKAAPETYEHCVQRVRTAFAFKDPATGNEGNPLTLLWTIHMACPSIYDKANGGKSNGSTTAAGTLKHASASAKRDAAKSAPLDVPWAAPDNDDTKASACSPVASIVGNPLDVKGFYAGAACGVLKGTNLGEQLVTMSAGLPSNLQVNALAVTSTGSDLYAGTQSGGVYRFTTSSTTITATTVVEFYNQSLDHYFITWVPDEIAKLDTGTVIKGWARTGQSFKTYTTAQSGTSPVCRYYIPPALGDSHFFGRGTTECNATGLKNPSFSLEDPAFMQMFLPTAGACPANTTQIYRVFSNRPDANHRYMTDKAIRAQMTAKGWLAEGDGPDLVVMCAPQ